MKLLRTFAVASTSAVLLMGKRLPRSRTRSTRPPQYL
jgi:hypothetical protein